MSRFKLCETCRLKFKLKRPTIYLSRKIIYVQRVAESLCESICNTLESKSVERLVQLGTLLLRSTLSNYYLEPLDPG